MNEQNSIRPPNSVGLPGARQQYPKNCWYVAAGRCEVTRTPLARKLLDTDVVLYRTEDGGVVAMHDHCPHRGYRLSKSKVVGNSIQCGYHGMVFDVQGQCTQIAGGGKAPNVMRVSSYPVVEQWHYVWIWLGDPAKADPALIPTSPRADDPNYDHQFHAPYPFYGNWQLAVDNLLDGTHASYLHAGMMDNEDKVEFTSEPATTVGGRVIIFTFDEKGFKANGATARLFHVPQGQPLNRRTRGVITLPGSVTLYAQFFTYTEEFDPENRDLLISEYVTAIGLTPADHDHGYHFTSVSSTFEQSEQDKIELAKIVNQDIDAFADIQAYFDEHPDQATETSVPADRLGIISRRIIGEMVQEESTGMFQI